MRQNETSQAKTLGARAPLVVLAGAIVSAVVLVVGAFLILSLTDYGLMLREVDHEGGLTVDVAERYGGVRKVMSEVAVSLNFLLNPVVALSVGLTIGLIARDRVNILAAISLTPFLILFLAANSWSLKAIALSFGYILAALLAAQFVFRKRSIRSEV
jgi:hypothetical protein